MPMDYKYLELELDAVEKREGGRVPQEMAKSDYSKPRLPRKLHPNQIAKKEIKTKSAVGAERTQVMRRERE